MEKDYLPINGVGPVRHKKIKLDLIKIKIFCSVKNTAVKKK